MLVVVDVGVCCKPKGECGFVAILWRSCQLNIITRTSVAGSQKKEKSQFQPIHKEKKNISCNLRATRIMSGAIYMQLKKFSVATHM
jgi:hypothetical protein